MKPPRLLRIIFTVVSAPSVVFLMALIARMRVLSQLLPDNPWRDFCRYSEPAHIAWALASGFGYSAPWPNTPIAATAQQPPVYPFLLAAVFKLAGSYSYLSLWIALSLNAVFSALTAVMMLRVGKRDFGTVAAVLAAWVWACWLYEAVVSIRLWESSLSALLLIIGIWLAPELVNSLRASRWLLLGLLAGIAALTNTTLLAVFPFFWLWLWISYRRRGKSCSRMLLASIGICILTLVPWTVRNYEAFHRIMPIRDNFGLEFWIGQELGARPREVVPPDFPLSDPSDYNRLGEIAFMESRRQMALTFVRQHPREYLDMTIMRCIRYWTDPRGTPWPILSLLAWSGLGLALWRKGLDAALYVVVLMVFPPVYYITHTFPTYRHPIEAVMLLLAAYAAVTLVQTTAGRLFQTGLKGASTA
jgi:4-amino-4-deoxy-L-arabinose transferase-like glycosyltransferase